MRILTISKSFFQNRPNVDLIIQASLYCTKYFNHRLFLCVLRLQHSKVKGLFLHYFKATSILLKV